MLSSTEGGLCVGLAALQRETTWAGLDEDLVRLVLDHPRRSEILREMAAQAVDLYEANRLLNAVVSDRGRFLAAAFALHLHDTAPGGLTPAALKAVCVDQGVCSPGRTSALIALMRWAGYLAPQGGRRLVPTEKLLDLHRSRLRGQLGIAAALSPAASAVLERFGEDEMVYRFVGAQAARFRQGFRLVDQAPVLLEFTERIGGVLILADIALGDWMAEGRELDLSVSALSRRFSVSRVHVNGVLRRAADLDLIVRDGASVRVTPKLSAALMGFFGAGLMLNLCAARNAVA